MKINKTKTVDGILTFLRSYGKRNQVKKLNKAKFKLLKKAGIPIKKLTSAQKAEIDAIYKKYGHKYSYDTHIITYSVTGKFDARILPEDMYRSGLELKLNDIGLKFVMSDKNYFEMYMPEVKFPDALVRNIEGVFYDKDRNIITKEEAESLISEHEKVVVKPATDNGFGKGVELIERGKLKVTESFKKNYLVQKLILQHPSLSAFNKSSVNVVRVVTMFLGDKVFHLTSAFRFGGEGSFTDNRSTKDGRGMTIVGIDEEGKLREKGYFSCGISSEKSHSGIIFKGYEIPKYKEMVDIALKQHSRFPSIRIIGWDFTVDREENVVVVEYNIKYPGVLYYQWVNGPLFGDKTEEILDEIKKLPQSEGFFKL